MDNNLIYFPSNTGSYFRDSFEVGIYKPSDKPVLEYANIGDKVYGSESFLVGNQIIPSKTLTTINESGNVYYTGPEDYLFGYILPKA